MWETIKKIFKKKQDIVSRNPYEMTKEEYVCFMREKEIDLELASNKNDIKRINQICEEMESVIIIN